MKSLNERLDLIKPKILSSDFRKGRGLGNEINFWIFDYDPEDEMVVRSHIEYLKTSINAERDDIRIVVYDLFDIMVEHLEAKNYLDKVLQMEQAKGSASIMNPIKKTLRLTLKDDVVVSRIAENVDLERDILFISGVGKAWPFIRSHTDVYKRQALNTVMMPPATEPRPMTPSINRKAMQTAGVSRRRTMTARIAITPIR